MKFNSGANWIEAKPENKSELSTIILTKNVSLIFSTDSCVSRVNFDYQLMNDLPADLMALICLIIWYPLLQKSRRITFPQNVSGRFIKVLELHKLTTNVNYDKLSDPKKKKSSKIALAWGGGLDSWAAYTLQPKLYDYLIHEVSSRTELPNWLLNQKNYPQIMQIQTNQREIFHDFYGWASWVAVLVTILWVSHDLNISTIALGGNLGSLFLQGGKCYHPTHLYPNKWFKTLNLLNLEIYLPLGGLTDLGVLSIISHKHLKLIKYCWLDNLSQNNLDPNCHQCDKCLRKDILLGRSNGSDGSKIKMIGPSLKYLQSRNTDLETWIKSYYQPAFELIPKRFVFGLQEKLHLFGIQLLPSNLSYLVEHYGYSYS